MNLSLLPTSPLLTILLKWTCLLAMGWLAQAALRNSHARWRLMLWRGILCCGLALPVAQFLSLPGFSIPVGRSIVMPDETPVSPAPPRISSPAQSKTAESTPASPQVEAGTTISSSMKASGSVNPSRHVSWRTALLLIWAGGCAWGFLRLFGWHRQIFRLRRESRAPSPEVQGIAKQIQVQLNIRSEVEVRISDAVTSPFVCGVTKPMVLLPRALAEDLSLAEVSALLSHEFAHLRRGDLIWCVAWRWMKTVCWFHPLVWRVPAAHNLACEQEADRVASSQLRESEPYMQMLARLALRILALPAVETQLTLNGGSQIAQRLKHLGLRKTNWSWRHSAAGFGLVALLFAITAGSRFSNAQEAGGRSSTPVQFKNVLVVVQDEDGKPIEGATISPEGFRVKGIHKASAYPWNRTLWGAPTKTVTDSEGKAYIKYPVMGIPDEKELTGELFFSVSHPGFVTVRPQEYSVDSPEAPIRLPRGIQLTVSGYFGSDHQPVTNLVPVINQEMAHPKDWEKNDDGSFTFGKLSAGGHLLQLMGQLPSGEIVYSETKAFDAESGKEYSFNLEMKPGIRLEGRLDNRVPRPVKNGRVLIMVRPPEFPAWTNWEEVNPVFKKYQDVNFWRSYRPIAEDGTFVFESIPRGGLDVIVHGDGFVSKDGGEFVNTDGTQVHNFAVPQAFVLETPVTRIEVQTEPTATVEVVTRTKGGKPIEGATVYLNPNVIRIGGIFGLMRTSSEEPLRTVPSLPELRYSATTDENGIAVIRNVPAATGGMDVGHPKFQLPLQDPKGWRSRYLHITCEPGMTNKMELTLELKGTDYIGSK